MAVRTAISRSFNRREGLSRGGVVYRRDSTRTKLCGYYAISVLLDADRILLSIQLDYYRS